MQISKKDWKLFSACVANWQETYMERLIILLDGEGSASDKFWKLEERIKKDKRHPGVLCEVSKENMIFDIVTLINSGVINIADLVEFSDGLKESVDLLLHRLQADG